MSISLIHAELLQFLYNSAHLYKYPTKSANSPNMKENLIFVCRNHFDIYSSMELTKQKEKNNILLSFLDLLSVKDENLKKVRSCRKQDFHK